MQYKIITSALFVVIFLSSCISTDKKSRDCNSLLIDDKNFSSKLEEILSEIQRQPRILFLNYKGGNYFDTMRLATVVSNKEIPVIITSEYRCLNDCSMVYFASPNRFSYAPLGPPRYAPSELDKISKLSAIDFYPIVEDEAMLSVISRHLSEQEINLLRTHMNKENFKGFTDLNTLSLEEVKRLTQNAQECEILNVDHPRIENKQLPGLK